MTFYEKLFRFCETNRSLEEMFSSLPASVILSISWPPFHAVNFCNVFVVFNEAGVLLPKNTSCQSMSTS